MTYHEFVERKQLWIETHDQYPNILLVGENSYHELGEMAKEESKYYRPQTEFNHDLYMIDGILLILDPEYPQRFSFLFDKQFKSYLTLG